MRGAGSYHFALREKIKGFETLKDIRAKGLVYESAAGVDHSTFGRPRDATVSTQVYHDARRSQNGLRRRLHRRREALL